MADRLERKIEVTTEIGPKGYVDRIESSGFNKDEEEIIYIQLLKKVNRTFMNKFGKQIIKISIEYPIG